MINIGEILDAEHYYSQEQDGDAKYLTWHQNRVAIEGMWKANTKVRTEPTEGERRKALLIAASYADTVVETLYVIPRDWQHRTMDIGRDKDGNPVCVSYAKSEAKAYELLTQRAMSNPQGEDAFNDTFVRRFPANRILKSESEVYHVHQ
jgi:hypothetical protein